MALRETRRGGHYFVWNSAVLDSARDCLFEPEAWRRRRALTGEAAGRGAAYFIETADHRRWVLRHSRRGGLLARLNDDRYLWTGRYRARVFAELRLLERMVTERLPVPRPVAARVVREGVCYRGDILIETIPAARPLADRLSQTLLACAHWRRLGATLARFHHAGIDHTDLNARNILVAGDNLFYLIDFDKARRRPPGRWRAANLARLRRSLHKFQSADAGFCFDAVDWQALCAGYQRAFERFL